MRQIRTLSFLICLALCTVTGLWGQKTPILYTTGQINRLELTPSNGLLFASRSSADAIEVEVELSFSRVFGTFSGTNNFSLRLQLLDEANAVVQTEVYFLGTRGTSIASEVHNYSIEPDEQLDVNKRYRVKAQIIRAQSSGFFYDNVGAFVQTSLKQYFHFINTQSSDAAFNVLFEFKESEWQQLFAIRTSPSQQKFKVEARGDIYRFDGYTGSTGSDNVEFVFTYELVNESTGQLVPTTSNESRHTVAVSRFIRINSTPYPDVITNRVFSIEIEPTGQLDSVNTRYYVRITGAHVEEPNASPKFAADQVTPREHLLHFSGDLDFGGVATTFTEVSNEPSYAVGGLNYLRTSLGISNLSGQVIGWDSYEYGNDELLSNVELMVDGTASVDTGEVMLSSVASAEPEDFLQSSGDIQFSFYALKLTPDGPVAGQYLNGTPTAGVLVYLPSGVGITNDSDELNRKRLIDIMPVLGPVALDSSFLPQANLEYVPPEESWFYQEGRPYGVKFERMVFSPATAKVTVEPVGYAYNHEAPLAVLKAQEADLERAEMAIKPSNEQYYRFVGDTVGNVIVTADAGGRALVSSELKLTPGEFTPHFPLTGRIKWNGNGVIVQSDNQIDPQTSFLEDVQTVSLTYHQSCPDAFCGLGEPPVEQIHWTSNSGDLNFTPDGGLFAAGYLPILQGLEWGFLEDDPSAGPLFAHRTGEFAKGHLLIAGHALLQGASAWNTPAAAQGYDFDQGPSALLLSGYDSSTMTHERVGTPKYILGNGDYAGLNFRMDDFDAEEGFSRLGRPQPSEPDMSFLPETNTKYYVRPAGVSGIHEAADGSYEAKPVIYGYQFALTNYGLSFLDSENYESQVNGTLAVPAPSNFEQDFEELILTCTGELEQAELDPEDLGAKALVYWNGSIEPKTLRFLAPTDDEKCLRTGDPILALGVTTQVAHIETTLFGEMGFFPDGQIAAPADGYPVSSRFQLPAQVELDGPAGEGSYTMTPVSSLYFNDESVGPNGSGFATFAATQDVPFFEDIFVQIMTSARADSSADFELVGGWPTKGWKDENGKSYFDLVEFDSENAGWPHEDVANYNAYHSPSSENPTDYTPIAHQSFFGVLDFAYPLRWNTGSRYYRSYQSATNKLMVVDIEHSVDYLSAEHIEVSFGVQYDGLPQLNVSNMLFNATEQHLGAGRAFIEGVQEEVVESISDGIDGLGDMLNDQIDAFYDELFTQLDSIVLEPVYEELGTAYQNALTAAQSGGPDLFSDFRANYAEEVLDQYLYDPSDAGASLLVGKIQTLQGGLAQQAGIIHQVDQRLAQVEQALVAIAGTLYVTEQGIEIDIPEGEVVLGILAKNENGDRVIVPKLVRALLAELLEPALADLIADELANSESALQQQLDELLLKAEPTLNEIEKTVNDLREEVSAIRAKLAVAGEIYDSINVIMTEAQTEIRQVAQQVRAEADAFLDELEAEYDRIYPNEQLGSIPNPFEEYPRDEVLALLRRELEDAIGASDFVVQIQYTLKQYLYDLNHSVETTIDSAFAEVNAMIRELINDTVVELENEINPLLGEFGDKVGAGQIDGLAHFRGDSLVRLRLDGSFQWEIPETLQFRGYMEFLELDSDGPGDCGGAAGEKLTEVSMGALDVPLDWISADMRADIGAKFSLSYNAARTPTVLPSGLGGSFEMTGGGLKFESFEIFDLKAAAAFGVRENFIAASVGMILSDYEASGGLFLGRACGPEPIILVDPLAGEVIGDGSFTGGYAYGEVWIPISEAALGIPASCMFRVSAGVGAGVFYFVEGPVFGGRMLAGASGEALCAVSIRGDVSMVGVKDGADFRFNGRGRLSGKAGPCPFCIKFGKTAKVRYDGSWAVDL